MPVPRVCLKVQSEQILELGRISRTIAETLHEKIIITPTSKLVLENGYKFSESGVRL